ncbi:MAG: glycosyltransferase family 2 protein [Chloroflexi bacterium]|nr:glycosyltransferase family 2 protein [Chloroflexota bacterium]
MYQRARRSSPRSKPGKRQRATSRFDSPPANVSASCSVIVCTRDRTEDLAQCLDSLARLKSRKQEIIVVDNAPSNRATEDFVREYQLRHPVRYVLERRPGLDIARNRGVLEARGEVVAFTDDDCIVDESWLAAILSHYDDPEVACVTGLIAPWEVETRAQEQFEFHYGGMSRGLIPFTMDFTQIRATDAGRAGAGANMSFRRSILLDIGLFNEALDCGMPTQSGGDSYAFYKVLSAGYKIAYEPGALVWHRHRRDDEHLKKQIYGYGVGITSHLVACLVEDHDLGALMTMWNLLRHWHLWRFIGKARGQLDVPLTLLVAELWGFFVGLWAYHAAKKVAAKSRQLFGQPFYTGATGEPATEAAFRRSRVSGKLSIDRELIQQEYGQIRIDEDR